MCLTPTNFPAKITFDFNPVKAGWDKNLEDLKHKGWTESDPCPSQASNPHIYQIWLGMGQNIMETHHAFSGLYTVQKHENKPYLTFAQQASSTQGKFTKTHLY